MVRIIDRVWDSRGHVAWVVTGLLVASLGFTGILALGETPQQAAQTPTDGTRNFLADAAGFDRAPALPPNKLALATIGQGETTEAEWALQVSNPNFWSDMRRRNGGGSGWNGKSQPSGLTKDTPASIPASTGKTSPGVNGDWSEDGPRRKRSGSTYRTMCVRLCDGFYWPVSFATTSDNFDKDSKACESSCGGSKGARLFVYPNPGGSIDDLEDTNGSPYKKLPKAFSFRANYDESCKCRPHPWEEAAQDQHKLYALEQVDQKKNPSVRPQIEALRKKLTTSIPQSVKGAAATPGGKQASLGATDAADTLATTYRIDPVKRMSRTQVKAMSQPVAVSGLPQAKFVSVPGPNGLRAGGDKAAPPGTVRLRLGSREILEVTPEQRKSLLRGAELRDTAGLKAMIVRQ